MATQRSAALGSLTAVSISTAVETSDGESGDVYISGTFVGTVIAEGSPDGTNYSPLTNGTLTAPGTIPVPGSCKKVRIRCSAFTSGTIVGVVGLRDEDRKG